jgi:catechol 2,3-dioxygenase-like lactoylglutathione lyase family enzyme
MRPSQPRLDHLGISVTDLARTETFYRDVLGADVVMPRHELDWGARTIVRLGSHFIDLNQISRNDGSPFDARRTGLDHLAFAADSRHELEAWAEWMDANGVHRSPIRDVSADPAQASDAPVAGSMFVFSDPDGIELEFLFFHGIQGPPPAV